jgi:hypothetical protein
MDSLFVCLIKVVRIFVFPACSYFINANAPDPQESCNHVISIEA